MSVRPGASGRTAGPGAIRHPSRTTTTPLSYGQREPHHVRHLSARVPVGHRHGRLPDRGRGTGERPYALHLGHLQPYARQGREGRQRRHRRRPLPPQGRGRPDDGGPRRERVPLLRLLAARPAHRPGPGHPARARLLPRSGRRSARPWHRTRPDALPLGPAPGVGGRGRLARARDGVPLRGVRAGRRRGARRPGDALDDPQRALVQRLPGVRVRSARPRTYGPGGRSARRPPSQPRPRTRGPGAALRTPGERSGLGEPQPGGGQGPYAVARGPGRATPDRRAGEPGLHRPDAGRRVPRGPPRGHRAADRLVVRPHRRRGREQAAAGLAGHQLLPARGGLRRSRTGRRGTGRRGTGRRGTGRRPQGPAGRPRRERALPLAGRRIRRLPPAARRTDRDGLVGGSERTVRPAAALYARGTGTAPDGHRERRGVPRQAGRGRRGPRPGPDPLSARPSVGGTARDRRRGGCARVLPLVADGQLRVGVRLWQALRRGPCGLRDAAPYAEVECALVPRCCCPDRPRWSR
ncbi:hypothetical protein CU044_5955 [Streptomyces sp. L-9-10]|nr:hypothetical protein CU044_5955 [Streptomyces sp. L-9-10]